MRVLFIEVCKKTDDGQLKLIRDGSRINSFLALDGLILITYVFLVMHEVSQEASVQSKQKNLGEAFRRQYIYFPLLVLS